MRADDDGVRLVAVRKLDAFLQAVLSELMYLKRLYRVLLKPREIDIDAEPGA